MIDEQFFIDGQLFDGSSIRGFASIHESDMQIIPDVTTAYLDAFRVEKTLIMIFDIYNPRNGEIYGRDPRQTARKAQAYLASTGIADTAFFAPEAEFFIFDDVRFEYKQNSSMHFVDSDEAAWNSGREGRWAETSRTRLHIRVVTSQFHQLTSTPTCVTRSFSS